jgi:hypothetical protein
MLNEQFVRVLTQEPGLFLQRLSKLRSDNWQSDHVNHEGQSDVVNREVEHQELTPSVCNGDAECSGSINSEL